MKRTFFGGFLTACLLLVACAHTFPYPYYTLQPDKDGELKAALYAADPKDDLPISRCLPDEQDKGKCIVVERAVWDAMRNERVELLERLKACEVPKP